MDNSASNRRTWGIAALALFFIYGLCHGAGADPVRVERRLEMMGTRFSIAVNAGGRTAALAAAEASITAVEEVEARLSTWRPDTELSQLNACPAGVAFTMSPELCRDLATARRWWEATDTCFDPAVGSLTEAWGVRTGGRRPGSEEIRAALKASGLGKLRFEENRVVRLPGVRIDEGGFGKGAGLDAAMDALHRTEAASAVLDLGGQMALFGSGGPVEIQVAHPADRQRPVLSLAIEQGSVATTGNSERPNHVIDPRFGRPARNFGSLTVWAPDALAADCLSTGLYVLGPDEALQRAMGLPNIEVLVLESSGDRLTARFTPGLAGKILSLEPTVRLVPATTTGPSGYIE